VSAADELRRTAIADVTVELWLDAWRIVFPSLRSATSARHDEYMLGPFRRRYGRRRLAEISPQMAQEWCNAHPAQVRYLREAWRKAHALRLVEINPWEHVTLPPRRLPHRGVPTQQQLAAVLDACSERGGWWQEYGDLVTFTAYTGARSAGVAGLRRSAVDLVNRRVVLCEKGAKVRRVAVLGHAAPALQRAVERHSWSELVFRSERRHPLTPNRIGVAWRAVRGDFPGPFHSLKHFAGTWLAAQGCDERDIAVQLGHTDAQGRPYTQLVRRIYVHPDHDAALDRIECQIAGGDGD
jgi:integrase